MAEYALHATNSAVRSQAVSAHAVMESFTRQARLLSSPAECASFSALGGVDQLVRLLGSNPSGAVSSSSTPMSSPSRRSPASNGRFGAKSPKVHARLEGGRTDGNYENHDAGSLSLRQNAAAALAVVCSDCPEACRRVQRVGGIGVLVAAARHEKEDTNLNRGVSLLLVQLCGSAAESRRFASMGGLGLSAKKLHHFATVSDKVTDNYMWLLTNAAQHADVFEQMVRHRSLVEALVHVLGSTSNFHILKHALALLSTVAVDHRNGSRLSGELREAVVSRITEAGGKMVLARAEAHLGGHRLSEDELQLCQWFKDHVQSAPVCRRGALLAFYRPSTSASGHLTALDVEVQAHYMRALSSLGLDLDQRSSFDQELSARSAVRKIREFLNDGSGSGSTCGGPDDLLTILYSGGGDPHNGDWNQFYDGTVTDGRDGGGLGSVSLEEVLTIWAGSAARLRGAVLFIVSDSSHSLRLVDQVSRMRPRNVVVQCAQRADDGLDGQAAAADPVAAALGGGDRGGGGSSTTTTTAVGPLLQRSAFLLQWLAGIAARKVPTKIMYDMTANRVQPACYWPDNFPPDHRVLSVEESGLEIPILDTL